MWEVGLSIVFFMLVVTAMSVGVIYGRKPIQGSCGGLNASGVCDLCGGLPEDCDSPGQNRSADANSQRGRGDHKVHNGWYKADS